MKNIFNDLEQLIIKHNINEKDINDIIQDNEDLFNFTNIKSIKNIWTIFKNIKIIYIKSVKWIDKNISSIKKIEKMMQNKKVNNLYKQTNIYEDWFLEIESIISFLKINFKPTYELVMQFNYEYHYYKSLYLYLFSTFDITACLLYFHYSNNKILSKDVMKKIKFIKTNSYLLHENKITNENLKKEIDVLVNSNSFKYISKTRNCLYHHFTQPLLRYHFSAYIMMCFIIIAKLIEILKNNL